MEKGQLEEMRQLFKLFVDMLDNQIKQAKIMEESFKIQAKQSTINKKQQMRLVKELDKAIKGV